MRTGTAVDVAAANPEASTLSSCCPGSIDGKLYLPLPSVVASRTAPAELVNVTFAPLTTAPLGSFTTPAICPVVGDCANAGATVHAVSHPKKNNATQMCRHLQFIYPSSLLKSASPSRLCS